MRIGNASPKENAIILCSHVELIVFGMSNVKCFRFKERVERGDNRAGSTKEIKGRTCTASVSNPNTVWHKKIGWWHLAKWSQRSRRGQSSLMLTDTSMTTNSQVGGHCLSIMRGYLLHTFMLSKTQLVQCENDKRTL